MKRISFHRFLALLLCVMMLGSMFTAAWADPDDAEPAESESLAPEEAGQTPGNDPLEDPEPDEDELPILPVVYLWLGETKVTASNAGDVFGDGTVSYSSSAKTLRFAVSQPNITGVHNGAVIDALNLTGLTIEAPEGLVLDSAAAAQGIRLENGALTLSGELKVTLSSAQAQYGVFAAKGITGSSSLTVSVPGENAVGLYTEGKISIGAGRWDVNAGKQAMLAKGGIEIPEGYGVTLPEGGKLGQTDGGSTVLDANGAAAAHAVIEELRMVTVTFDLNYEGGDPIRIQIPKGGSVAQFPEIREHGEAPSVWKLVGWYTEKASGTDVGKLGEPVTAETRFDVDSTVFAHWRLPGDINGDGVVNNKDVTRLIRTLKYGDVAAVTASLDTNGDGAQTNKDVTRLIRYIKSKDVEVN